MFSSLLLYLLIVDSVILMVAILLQAGKGGGLASTFGGVSSSADTIFGSRQAGNLLTKASWWCGGLFLGLACLLSLASGRTTAPKSVLDQPFTQQAPVQVNPGAAALPLQPATPETKKPVEAPGKKAPPPGTTKKQP